MTLSVQVKKWLLNERKLQQQEDNRKKRSLGLVTKDKTKIADRFRNNSALC
jgi:hypothetical protein